MLAQILATLFVLGMSVVLVGVALEGYLEARDKERRRRESRDAR